MDKLQKAKAEITKAKAAIKKAEAKIKTVKPVRSRLVGAGKPTAAQRQAAMEKRKAMENAGVVPRKYTKKPVASSAVSGGYIMSGCGRRGRPRKAVIASSPANLATLVYV
jgi:hypothetical protein